MSIRKLNHLSFCLVCLVLIPDNSQAQLAAPILPAPAEIEIETNKIPSNRTDINSEGRISVILRESLFRSIPAEPRVDEGPVRDFILGADVVGVQRTVSELAVDFLPSPNAALLNFQLTGTTNNQTTSITPQAAIRNCGRYDFILNKRVQFDGEVVTTWSPSALLRVEQKNVGASTPLAPLPILGRIAEQTAINIANQQLPEAEQIAAFKVTQQVAPEFNNSVDLEISKVNRQHLPDLRSWLNEYELGDLAISSKTTDTEIVVNASTATYVAPQQAIQIENPASSGALILNEGVLNNLLQRLPLAGRKITDTQAEAILENQKIDFDANYNPKLVTLILDQQRPIAVFLRNGGLEVEARLSIQPILGQAIGSHLFAFRLTAIPDGDSIQLVPTVLQVRPIDENAAVNLLFSPEVIEQQISGYLEPITVPRQHLLPFLPDYPEASLNVVDIRETSGELKVEFQVNLQ